VAAFALGIVKAHARWRLLVNVPAFAAENVTLHLGSGAAPGRWLCLATPQAVQRAAMGRSFKQ